MLFEGKKATGVEFVRNNKLETLSADKEVLLSAGAVGSPHILMLSGVGHKDHLKSFGVTYISVLDLVMIANIQMQCIFLPIPFWPILS